WVFLNARLNSLKGAIKMTATRTPIGLIGTGVMGQGMAHNLLKAGYPVSVYTRTKEKADDLVSRGAKWKRSVAELSQQSQVIITMVGFPEDVENVYFNPDGILENAKE